jgi:hypothetical protein
MAFIVDCRTDPFIVSDRPFHFHPFINNHGVQGWNWGFADGHAQWVPKRTTAYMLTNSYMLSGADCSPN